MKHLHLLVRKEFLQIKRDHLSLRLLIMMPIMQLLVLGFALNKDVKNLSYSIFDLDQSPFSQELRHVTQSMPAYIHLREVQPANNAQEALISAMKFREIQAGLILPPDFSRDFQNQVQSVLAGENGNPPRLQLLLNGEDANGAAIAAGYLSGAIQQWSFQELQHAVRREGGDPTQLEPLKVQRGFRFNPELISAWFMIPGIAAILVTMVCSLLVAFSVVREIEKGTLEQLLVTPVGVFEVLLSKTIPYLMIGFVELFIVLGLGHLIFGVPIQAKMSTLIFFNFLYMIPILGLAILISTLVRTQQQALFLVWFCLIFFLLTGGFLLPWENMPNWLKIITEMNPLRFYITVLRESLLKSASISQLLNEALHLFALGIFFFGGAILSFKRKVN